ncbi:MAG: WS/DGAT/MGAT family O-acyltransferase [Desertimonas sp.]
MKQLTGIDASFLYMETPSTFGHVSGLLVFDRPDDDFDPYEAVYAKYESMVGDVEPMRRRLVEVPFGLDHPWWVQDAETFDLSFHVRALNLAKPGMVDQLAEQVARIHGRPMDRTRPLWEAYVIDGLDSGRWALLTKYHHATIDGASGQIMLEMMTTPTSEVVADPEPTPWQGETAPSQMELLRRAVDNLMRNPARSARTQLRIVRDVASAAGLTSVASAASQAAKAVKRIAAPEQGQSRVAVPTSPAPPTPWNKAITQHRRFAIRTSSLSNIKAIKDATGGTVNDVVMAICAGGLRTYLLRHDALPDRPLRAMVPVSIRTGNETDPWTNRVSSLVAELPTDEPDPVVRVARCREAMQAAKRNFELVPAEALVDITQFSSPVLATAAIRLSSRLGVADRVSSVPFNLTISNVPGPRQPLYFAGAQMQHQFPVSIVTDGQGLNITVQSYMDRMDFGLIADRELIPDLWDMVDDLVDEIGVLIEASGAEWVVPPAVAHPRRGLPGHSVKPAPAPRAEANGAAKKSAAKKTATKSAAKKSAAKKPAAKKPAAKKTTT